MQTQEVSQYWDTRAQGYSATIHHQFQSEIQQFYRTLLRKCAPPGHALRCLDVGCGPGFFSILLAQAGHQVTAVDFSQGMLEKASENFAQVGVQVCTVQADAQDLPFESDQFDYLVSRDLTWALRNPRKTYIEWIRVLKPRGKLLVVDSNHYLHYHDQEYAQAQKEIVPTYQMYGVDPTVMDKFAQEELPLSRVRRPQWDVDTFLDLGLEHIELEGNRQSFQDPASQKTKSVMEDFFVCATKPSPELSPFMGTISFFKK